MIDSTREAKLVVCVFQPEEHPNSIGELDLIEPGNKRIRTAAQHHVEETVFFCCDFLLCM